MPLHVLKLLSADEFRSGEEISRVLAVSRASVHNAVARAREMGVDIQAVTGRGYRLARHYDWLDDPALAREVARLGYALEVLDEVDSTNTRLLARVPSGGEHRAVLAAEMQTGGRGRRGRTWHSRLGGGLTFSVLWRFQRPLTALSGLSLAVGLALARALAMHGGRDVRLKWPNDVLLEGGKAAGILIETQGDVLNGATAVIGIGVNVRDSRELREQVDQAMAALMPGMDGELARGRVLLDILSAMDDILSRFDVEGFAPFREEWQDRMAWRGEEVSVEYTNQTRLIGVLAGVDPSGLLLLRTPEGLMPVHSGEVSLRRRP